jgi:uncharacterized protein involved in exopolysaccharide biosynthesis
MRRGDEALTADKPEYEDEIGLYHLNALFWSNRWFIFWVTLVATAGACVATLFVHKRYEASVTISPISETESSNRLGALSSMTSQFSGLASLAGISVGSDSKKSESLAVLQSQALTRDYIQKNDLLPVLYPKKWDAVGKKWKPMDPDDIPTLWKANRFFKNKIRTVTTDTKTSLVTLTITWTDPAVATKWANDIVRLTNDTLRQKEIDESERNIAYLNEEAAKTDVVAVRQGIYTLMQSEINKVMVARGSEEFALKVVDPAFVAELPSSPKLLLWGLGGFFGGCFASMLTVLLRNAWRGGNLKKQ